ncbi:hypothetical protein PR202_gb24367 [Eleusine coracana subsp. coracana]|uniref:Endonuclease/exonuclease/phosphatase domain-containing protein n=1 Tax=Eleusine coracana subsp. coracana TaxID=191504 RepID=A0AAV5FLU2_ELECO|nr:hypothetical protein PR202_gb24367 [Eleusine coracana subsp. coracana]
MATPRPLPPLDPGPIHHSAPTPYITDLDGLQQHTSGRPIDTPTLAPRSHVSRKCRGSGGRLDSPSSLLSWNCQSSGPSLSSTTLTHLARLISSTRVQVIFISETRSVHITKSQLISHYSLQDAHVVPAAGQSGGLWLMWKDDVDLTITYDSHHLILAQGVFKTINQTFNLVCMYGDPHHVKTTSIWQEVASFMLQNQNIPTFCMGDLNNIMHVNEKCGPNPANAARIRNFCCLVKNYGFFDLGYSGSAYTWTNKCFTTNPTFQRLDRCLANAEWCAKFPRTAVFHLSMIYSDHAPILVILDSHSQKVKKPFRFENWWLLEDDLSPIAANSWRQIASKPFHTRTKILATDIKTWRKKKKPLNQ